MKRTLLEGFLVGMLGCSAHHSLQQQDYRSREIASIVYRYGDVRPSGHCITMQSNIGDMVICSVYGSNTQDTSDDFLLIRFPTANGEKTYTDYALDDTVDYITSFNGNNTITKQSAELNNTDQRIVAKNYAQLLAITKKTIELYNIPPESI